MVGVNTLLKEIALNELSNTNVLDKTVTANYIHTDHLEKIIYLLNDALTELHTEFMVLKKEVLIQLEEPLTYYYLQDKYAQSNTGSSESIKYIHDTVENPFYPYVIQPLYVANTSGIKIPVNDFQDVLSCAFVGFDCIQFRNMDYGEYFSVLYQADHVPISTADLENQTVTLPPYLFKALKQYVAYLFFSNIQGQANDAHSMKYRQLYEACIQKVKDKNLIPNYNYDSNIKLDTRGFV